MSRSDPNARARRPHGLRWWPAALIVVAAAGLLAWTWSRPAGQNQSRVIATMAVSGGAAILLALWWLFASGVPARTRYAVAAGGALLALAFVALVEVRGVTGDLVPILGWRFDEREDAFRSAGAEVPAPAPAETPRDAPPPWRDFPQFRGPGRDGRIEGVALERDWSARPPRVLWRRPVGPAWAGFAVAGRDALTQEQRGEREAVVCYDLLTGAERWAHEHEARYETTLGGVGPRATPTIAGERVYAFGATGILDALDRRTGAVAWERDVLADAGAENNNWGTSSSPLLLDGRVIVKPGGAGGGSLVAYEAADGARAWAGGSDTGGYSSPVLVLLAGVPQLLSFNHSSLSAHDPGDGRSLWSAPWTGQSEKVAQPVVVAADALVISSGYGVGAARFRVSRGDDGSFAVEQQWKSSALKAKFANFVLREGALYGMDDGILACVDAATGRRLWKGGRYGHGQLLLVGDVLLVMAETGAVVLVEATPVEHRELARFEVFADKTWNPPAFAVPYLVIRNDVEACCLELPLAGEPWLGDDARR